MDTVIYHTVCTLKRMKSGLSLTQKRVVKIKLSFQNVYADNKVESVLLQYHHYELDSPSGKKPTVSCSISFNHVEAVTDVKLE